MSYSSGGRGGAGGGGGGNPGRSYDGGGGGTTILKLKGLPFQAGEREVFDFFHGFNILGAYILMDMDGRPSGMVRVFSRTFTMRARCRVYRLLCASGCVSCETD
jgi:hypothetical protein